LAAGSLVCALTIIVRANRETDKNIFFIIEICVAVKIKTGKGN
jgi:hypothetical protein